MREEEEERCTYGSHTIGGHRVNSGQPEITNLQPPKLALTSTAVVHNMNAIETNRQQYEGALGVGEKDVGALDVPVNNGLGLRVEVLQALQNILGQFFDHAARQRVLVDQAVAWGEAR